MKDSLNQQLAYFALKEDSEEPGIWDNGHIETQQFLSICCQSPVSTSGSETFCSECQETLDPETELISKSDEDNFLDEDYRASSDEILAGYRDFS